MVWITMTFKDGHDRMGQNLPSLFCLSLLPFLLAPTRADYKCICNHKMNNKAYEHEDITSRVLCYLYKGDCLYYENRINLGFQPFPPQQLPSVLIPMTYVESDSYLQTGVCAGNRSNADTCKLFPEFAASDSTSSSTTLTRTTEASSVTTRNKTITGTTEPTSTSATTLDTTTISTPTTAAHIITCDSNVDYRGTVWPKTQPETVSVACLNATGMQGLEGSVVRVCTEKGEWQPPYYDCVSHALLAVREEIKNQFDFPDGQKLQEALATLATLTSAHMHEDIVYEGVLTSVADMLGTVAEISNNITVTEDQAAAFINISATLLDTQHQRQWRVITEIGEVMPDIPSIKHGAANVLLAVESYSQAVANSLDPNNSSLTISQTNMVLHVALLNQSDPDRIDFPDSMHIDAPTNSVISVDKQTVKDKGIQSYAGILYTNLTGFLPSTAVDGGSGTRESRDINSVVLALSVHGNAKLNNVPVTIHFEHFQTSFRNPLCSFWDYTTNAWNSSGCYQKGTSSASSICRCSHLTNFALLMSPWTTENTGGMTLDIVTMVGCAVSLAGLVATIAVHVILWRFMKSSKAIILMNLSAALVLSYVLFLAGVDQTQHGVACRTIAIALHYIYLVVFALMLVEGIELATSVLLVFPKNSYLAWKLLLAWGLPAVVVGASAGITKLDGYGTTSACWLSINHGLIWAFVGPAAFIMLVNCALIVAILRAMLRTRSLAQKRLFDKIKASLRGLCVLLPLMGCTWALGLLYVNRDWEWAQYAFAACNSLQGLVIFIIQVLVNKQIRVAIQRRRRKYVHSDPSYSIGTKPKKISRKSADTVEDETRFEHSTAT